MPTFRSVAAAAVAAAALSVPASASAEIQTSTLKYQCKYPLIGVKALDLKVDLDIREVAGRCRDRSLQGHR